MCVAGRRTACAGQRCYSCFSHSRQRKSVAINGWKCWGCFKEDRRKSHGICKNKLSCGRIAALRKYQTNRSPLCRDNCKLTGTRKSQQDVYALICGATCNLINTVHCSELHVVNSGATKKWERSFSVGWAVRCFPPGDLQ